MLELRRHHGFFLNVYKAVLKALRRQTDEKLRRDIDARHLKFQDPIAALFVMEADTILGWV